MRPPNRDWRSGAGLLILERVLPMSSSITTRIGRLRPFPPSGLNSITGIGFRTKPGGRSVYYEHNALSLFCRII